MNFLLASSNLVSPSQFTFQVLGLLCLLPLLLILAILVIWRWGRRVASGGVTPLQRHMDVRANPVQTQNLESPCLKHGSVIWKLHENQTLGQAAENTLFITESFTGWETVSAVHARLFHQQDQWIIEDLGSLNGTYINGTRTGINVLRDGDKVNLGAVEFIFCVGEQAGSHDLH